MRRKNLAALLSALLLLTGCAAQPVEREPITGQLPAPHPGPAAPIGDSQSSFDVAAVLYIPDLNAERLRASVQTVTVHAGQTLSEACVQALLDEVNQNGFGASKQPLQLAIASNPVETTGSLATVNLYRTARALSNRELFSLEVAITNTLTELSGIRHVCVLIEGQDPGLGFQVPTGAFSRYPSGDITTFWAQIDAQVASPDSPLVKAMPLYFLSADGKYLLGEVRDCTFPDRDEATYARVLLDELNKGASQIEGAIRIVPDFAYFDRDPVFSEGDRVISLYFHPAIDDDLKMRDATRGMLLSTIVYTLTSCIPGLAGVRAYVGDDLVSALMLMNDDEWTIETGPMRRADFESLAADICTVYFPMADGSGLRAVQRPILQRYRSQPRALLREAMSPPNDPDFAPALPEGTTEADILGLQLVGDTALVNLSGALQSSLSALSEAKMRDTIFSIVNTLTEARGVRRVRIYFNGEQNALPGGISIEGEFLRNEGLIRR